MLLIYVSTKGQLSNASTADCFLPNFNLNLYFNEFWNLDSDVNAIKLYLHLVVSQEIPLCAQSFHVRRTTIYLIKI